MPGFTFNSAIVRAPGPAAIHGLRATPGPAPDFPALQQEHADYTQALREAGLRVTVLPALDAFPDSLFVEDPALVFSHTAILLRPGAPSRLMETRELLPALRARFDTVLEVRTGFADGGDILVTPREVLIGLSSRTDPEGAAELQSHLASLGLRGRVVPVPRGTLHLKTDCSLIDEETLLATDSLAASGVLTGYRVLTVHESERAATNAVRVNRRVLVRDDSPRTAETVAGLGLTVVPLRVAEMAKLDAGLSCMSLRWFDPKLAL